MSCDNSVSSNRSLAKRMRMEDPDQFQTLVRMHLSFVLHLTLSDTEADGNSDKPKIRPLKWGIAPFTRKLKNFTKETAKEDEPPGVPLTRSTVAQVNKLITYLTKEENIVQEGVFRRSGKLTRQQELKAALAKNGSVDLSSYSVHDVASVLKSILAELPEPLLTDIYYPAYCQIADLCSGEQSVNQCTRVLRSLQLLFLLLPRENRRLLKNLLRLLHLTASHESSNRMSPQNLATLFTPHLLCSRKLSPEVFHSTAANLSCVVVFMINESTSTFGIPEALATDIHAYWEGKRKNTFLERSISEAKTVFSFTDRELSQKEDAVNPTETALAQLYAHIQGLPESSHKKRLIKQFNKENGNGTPRTKSLGISIKKHIFSKNAKAKGYTDYLNLKNSGMASSHHSLLNSPERKMPRTPLTAKLRLNLGSCSDQKKSPSPDDDEDLVDDVTTDDSLSTTGSMTTTPPPSPAAPPPLATGNLDSPRRHWPTPDVLTSTPAIVPSANTPVGLPDDMSPITRSAQRMPKAMQVKLPSIVVPGLPGDSAFSLLETLHQYPARARSDDHSQEPKTSGCPERIKPVSARQLDLGNEGPIMGSQPWKLADREQSEIGRREDRGCSEWEWGGLTDVTVQGLSFQSQRPHGFSRRSQLLIKNGGFRPLVVRRRHRCPALGLPDVLPRRGVSIIDQEFWLPPQKGPLLGRHSDEWEEVGA